MPVRDRTVRCKRCHQRASAHLVVCPHCGRDLHPARSRWLTWGAPLGLVVLFALLFVARGSRSNPITWAQARVASLGAVMGDISTQLDPEVNIVFVPPDTDVEVPLVSQAAIAATTPSSSATDNGAAQPDPAAPPAAAPIEAPAAAPTVATAVVESTAPSIPEQAATSQSSLDLTLPTPTPAASVYRVQRGDTVFDIALRYGVTEDDLLAANGLTARDAFVLQPGQELVIPVEATATPETTPTDTPAPTATPAATNTATPAPTATPTVVATSALTTTSVLTVTSVLTGLTSLPTGTPTPSTAPALPTSTPTETATPEALVYTVLPGDTLSGIAIRNGVTTEAILTANNLTIAEGRLLRPGQRLVIPSRIKQNDLLQLATATPVVDTATTRLTAPILRSPANAVNLSCNSNATLTWDPVPEIRVDDLYVVHLGYVDAGGAVVWVAQPQRAANVIAWEVDSALCDLPPAAASGAWQWWVEVVAATGQQPVSPPSETRSFIWR